MAKEFAKKFYNSKKWKDKRAKIFNRAFGLCEICSAGGEEVHHKISLTPLNIDNVDISLGDDNLILLCKDCHFAMHEQENFKSKKINRLTTKNWTYFTDDGDIEDIKVKIVYGSPCSGKSSYVKEHMNVGDIVIDIDLLKAALSGGIGNVRTNELDNISRLCFEVRDYIYKLIEDKSIVLDSKCIWIVGMFVDRDKREELSKCLGAELIYIDTTIDECITRLMHDDSRTDKRLQRTFIIDYFERFKK